jgi:LuxR family transcriptional regulator, maltose regulon positive regulatory protein
MQLIRSKIERPNFVPHLVRERLVGALEQSSLSCLSTLVIGRAGTGKSVAALDLADRSERRVGWYTVDASDTDFRQFARYLVASLDVGRRASSWSLLPWFDTTPAEEIAPFVAECILIDLFEWLKEPLLVVFEDLHLVYDEPWFGPFITRFLPMLPLNVHVLVTARGLPPAPLWRLRSKQALSVVDEDALAFTEAEAVQLFERYGLGEDVARVAVRTTRGRASQLDAVARSLADHPPLQFPPSVPASLLRRTG